MWVWMSQAVPKSHIFSTVPPATRSRLKWKTRIKSLKNVFGYLDRFLIHARYLEFQIFFHTLDDCYIHFYLIPLYNWKGFYLLCWFYCFRASDSVGYLCFYLLLNILYSDAVNISLMFFLHQKVPKMLWYLWESLHLTKLLIQLHLYIDFTSDSFVWMVLSTVNTM